MVDVKTSSSVKAGNLLEVVCEVSLSPLLKKNYTVTYGEKVRQKCGDESLIREHTLFSREDFKKVLSRLNDLEVANRKDVELER